ncbi:AhpC/TSA family protein [Ekhidna lutea]|uniref:AhpC/TSA family protein n=1 Tax=Ekhidna lutea TaxID=447679 RepID=A0A239F601_EKHLU|nr:TlpA disulfide reductase family protein [Ekhidna lutea]SNS52470.1 AhpC/TSA family protein [Ekhidna lutea]
MMKKAIFTIFVLISLQLSAQNVEVVKFSDLQKKMLYTEAPLTVFNFWATWCGPCIKELPHFDNLESNNNNVKVYLVSIDFQNELERVQKFVSKKSLQSDVLFLDEKDPDDYMGKVSQEWSGAIPATLFVTDLGKTYFHEKAFTKEELEKTVKKYLN